MPSIPVTPEDFIRIGERYDSDDIVAEIERLRPVAQTDIAYLSTRGYSQSLLDQLDQYRADLTTGTAGRDQKRGAKKGARKVEADAIDEGKHILRSGVTIATAAITHRKPAPGETAEETKHIVSEVVAKIDALGGRIGTDSVKLRSRLTALTDVLGLTTLAPAPAEAQARAEFLAKVDDALKALPELADQKKGAQQGSKSETASVNEIDGRAYVNLRTLVQAGRAYWTEHHDRKRAAEYNLNGLLDRTAKKKAEPKPD